MSGRLVDLPPELVHEIAKYLPTSHLRCVCKDFSGTMTELWKAGIDRNGDIVKRWEILEKVLGTDAAMAAISRERGIRSRLVTHPDIDRAMYVYGMLYQLSIQQCPSRHLEYLALTGNDVKSSTRLSPWVFILMIISVLVSTMAIVAAIITYIVDEKISVPRAKNIYICSTCLIVSCIINILSIVAEIMYRVLRGNVNVIYDIERLRRWLHHDD